MQLRLTGHEKRTLKYVFFKISDMRKHKNVTWEGSLDEVRDPKKSCTRHQVGAGTPISTAARLSRDESKRPSRDEPKRPSRDDVKSPFAEA